VLAASRTAGPTSRASEITRRPSPEKTVNGRPPAPALVLRRPRPGRRIADIPTHHGGSEPSASCAPPARARRTTRSALELDARTSSTRGTAGALRARDRRGRVPARARLRGERRGAGLSRQRAALVRAGPVRVALDTRWELSAPPGGATPTVGDPRHAQRDPRRAGPAPRSGVASGRAAWRAGSRAGRARARWPSGRARIPASPSRPRRRVGDPRATALDTGHERHFPLRAGRVPGPDRGGSPTRPPGRADTLGKPPCRARLPPGRAARTEPAEP
jgi:hypothetical protein